MLSHYPEQSKRTDKAALGPDELVFKLCVNINLLSCYNFNYSPLLDGVAQKGYRLICRLWTVIRKDNWMWKLKCLHVIFVQEGRSRGNKSTFSEFFLDLHPFCTESFDWIWTKPRYMNLLTMSYRYKIYFSTTTQNNKQQKYRMAA
jgi:hypothetical protein